MGPIKLLYNSKFDFTAKSLVTNIVVITRVICNRLEIKKKMSSLLYLFHGFLKSNNTLCRYVDLGYFKTQHAWLTRLIKLVTCACHEELI